MFSGFSEPLGFEKLALAPSHPFYIERWDACWLGHWPVSMHPTQNTVGGAMGAKREINAQFFMEIFAYFYQIRIMTLLLFVSEIHWSKIPITWQ